MAGKIVDFDRVFSKLTGELVGTVLHQFGLWKLSTVGDDYPITGDRHLEVEKSPEC